MYWVTGVDLCPEWFRFEVLGQLPHNWIMLEIANHLCSESRMQEMFVVHFVCRKIFLQDKDLGPERFSGGRFELLG